MISFIPPFFLVLSKFSHFSTMNIYDIKFLKAFLKTEIYSRDCSSENSVEHMLKKLINIRGFYDFF